MKLHHKMTSSLFFFLILGCSANSESNSEEMVKEYPQKCLMCGSEWIVIPNSKNDEPIPSTVEWCFNDGGYCRAGIDMIIEGDENGASESLELRWINHCLKCKGCRCAAFQPDEWKKITDSIDEIRK